MRQLPVLSMQCTEKWVESMPGLCIKRATRADVNSNSLCREIIEDFDNNIELLDIKKPRVGVVGEILVKFLPAANNYLVDLLESEGAEAVVPDLLDFLLYCFYNQNFKVEKLGFEKKKATTANPWYQSFWNGSVLRQPKHLQQSKHFASTCYRSEDLGKMACGHRISR